MAGRERDRDRDRDRELLIIPVTGEPAGMSGGGEDSEPTSPVIVGSPSARGHHSLHLHHPTGIEVIDPSISLNVHKNNQ